MKRFHFLDLRSLRPGRLIWGALIALVCYSAVACASTGVTSRPTPSPIPTATTDSADPTSTVGVPAPSLPGWRLIWNDEFNGTTVDTSRWTVASSVSGGFLDCCLAYGGAAWSPDNVAVSNGHLHLISTDSPLAGQRYTSGAVTTAQTFSFTYGRVDIRARLPRTAGLWPAFWMIPVAGTSPGYAPYEIDFLEAWGANPREVFAYFHWQSLQIQCEASGPDYSADFHVYTLIWKPGELDWAVDGVTRCVTNKFAPDVAMYLNLSTAVGGKIQATDSTTRLPQSTDIDYVRIWKPA